MTMKVELFINQKTQGNSYLICNNGDCYIVDPGGYDMSNIIKYIELKELNLQGILITHGHYDHIIGIPEIIKYKKVPVYIGYNDFDFLYDSTLSLSLWSDIDFKLSKNIDVIKLKEDDEIFGFKVIETPGHTHGGVCYYDASHKVLFSGDTIFKMSYGRTDLPTGNIKELEQAIQKIFELNPDVAVYPGHGGATTIRSEKSNNFFN